MRGRGCSEGENCKALWDKGKGGGEGIPKGRQTEDTELQVKSALFTSQSLKKQDRNFLFFLIFFFTLILRFIPEFTLCSQEATLLLSLVTLLYDHGSTPLFYESTSRGDVS